MADQGSNDGLAVVFHPSDDSYGVDRVLTRIVDVLQENGWRIRCVVESANPGTGWLSDELSRRQVVVEKARLANLVRRQLTNPLLLLRWLGICLWNLPRAVRNARQSDLVYVNGFTLPLAALAGRLARRPVIWHLHEIPPGGRAIGRVIRLLSQQQICVSAAVAEAFGLAQAVSCQVVHNAVDVPARAVPQLDVSADSPLDIGIVARINRGKGHLVLAEAFEALLGHGLPVRLHIVGGPHSSDTSVAEALHQRFRDVPSDRIVWAGEVPSGSGYMQKLQVLAAPSVRPDPFPLSVLEGMAAGLVVVASDDGGHREAIRDGVTGMLCRTGDSAQLAGKLQRLVEDAKLRRELANAARAEVVARFAPEVFAENLNGIVRSVRRVS